MEVKSYYKAKRVLITGATGFLGKVVLEKILWETPDVEKIILLIRPSGTESFSKKGARRRFTRDILPSRIFDRLKKREEDFSAFMRAKIECFPCDLFDTDIGISEKNRETIFNGLDAVIHIAAQVSWNERIDYSVRVNTLATRRLLEYAGAVSPPPRFVHISSAYVNGQRSGTVNENPFDPEVSIAGELGGKVPFSIEDEIAFALAYAKKVEAESYDGTLMDDFRRKAELKIALGNGKGVSLKEQAEKLRKKYVRETLSGCGMKQANLHGWTDTYTFSKAMAEMLLIKHRQDVPLAIVRPPGITGAIREPMPGWLEGFHLVEPLIVGMGKGMITAFPGSKKSLIDTVPVDKVVNLIISACAKLDDFSEPCVYQIGTSQTNPITLLNISKIWRSYFRANPMRDAKGKKIKVGPIKFYRTVEAFNRKINLKYVYPLTVAQNILLHFKIAKGLPPYRKIMGWVDRNKTLAERVCRFSDLYSAYTMNSWIFSSERTRELFRQMSGADRKRYDFDTSQIDWRAYWMKTHIPGMKKYVLNNG